MGFFKMKCGDCNETFEVFQRWVVDKDTKETVTKTTATRVSLLAVVLLTLSVFYKVVHSLSLPKDWLETIKVITHQT